MRSPWAFDDLYANGGVGRTVVGEGDARRGAWKEGDEGKELHERSVGIGPLP